mgnify:CR=1 FL=1
MSSINTKPKIRNNHIKDETGVKTPGLKTHFLLGSFIICQHDKPIYDYFCPQYKCINPLDGRHA